MDVRKDSPGIRSANAAYIEKLLELILPPLRLAARGEGYAIAVHGSLARDIDLVAIPRTETARAPDLLIETMRGIIAGITGSCHKSSEVTEKPHGRKAWMLIHGGFHAEIDISVMPLRPDMEKK